MHDVTHYWLVNTETSPFVLVDYTTAVICLKYQNIYTPSLS